MQFQINDIKLDKAIIVAYFRNALKLLGHPIQLFILNSVY